MDAIGFGFRVTMWLLGKTAQVAGKGVGAAMAAGGQAMQGKPVDVHQFLQSQRPRPEQGVAIKPIACPLCNAANETGQVECYKCGKNLLEGLITPTPLQSQATSPVTGQVMVLGLFVALAIILMAADRGSGAGATLGLILFFVCIAWAVAIIRLNLSKG